MSSSALLIGTWNIQLGLQLDRILQALAHPDMRRLDMLALQEASIHGGQPDAARVAAALGRRYEYYQVTAHILGGLPQANAVVWNSNRIEINTRQILHLPRHGDVALSRAERTLLSVLPRQSRLSVRVEGRFGQETVRMYAAHLDVIGFAHKREQFYRVLRDAVDREPVDWVIVAGDMNTFRIRTRPNWGQLMALAETAGFRDLTREILWTHAVPQFRVRQKLDSIFVRHAPLPQGRAWSLELPGSDHIPVLAELATG